MESRNLSTDTRFIQKNRIIWSSDKSKLRRKRTTQNTCSHLRREQQSTRQLCHGQRSLCARGKGEIGPVRQACVRSTLVEQQTRLELLCSKDNRVDRSDLATYSLWTRFHHTKRDNAPGARCLEPQSANWERSLCYTRLVKAFEWHWKNRSTKLKWMRDRRVNNGTRFHVSRPIGLLTVHWKETNVMPFLDRDETERWFVIVFRKE